MTPSPSPDAAPTSPGAPNPEEGAAAAGGSHSHVVDCDAVTALFRELTDKQVDVKVTERMLAAGGLGALRTAGGDRWVRGGGLGGGPGYAF